MRTEERLHRDFAELTPSVETGWLERRYLDALPPGSTIVEVGVGDGSLANKLHQAGHRVHAVDVSPYCLEKLDPGIVRHRADIESAELPFESESVDALVILNVLEHLREPEAFLVRAKGFMKPGGLILAATPNINWWLFRLYFLLGRSPEDFHHTNHVQFWNLRQFARLFADAGWAVEAQPTSLGLPNPLYWFRKSWRRSGMEAQGRSLFVATGGPHRVLGYEQAIVARAS